MKLILRHMAKMQYLNGDINDDDRRMIKNHKCYREYYHNCLQELKEMKKAKLRKSLSLLDILIQSAKVKINEELVKVFEKNNNNRKFPIYFASLKKKIYADVEDQKM